MAASTTSPSQTPFWLSVLTPVMGSSRVRRRYKESFAVGSHVVAPGFTCVNPSDLRG